MGRRLPPLNQLRAFEAAARHLSFKKAAEELQVTRAAISHQVRTLEEFFGVQLFWREGRGVSLNNASTRYYLEVGKALDRLGKAGDILESRSLEQTLRMSVAPSFGTRWLLPRIDLFQAANPEIKIIPELSTDVADFRTDQFDLAIRHGRGNWPNVSKHLVYIEKLAPVYAPGFFPDDEPPSTADQLIRYQLLSVNALKGEWEAWCKQFGIHKPILTNIIYFPTHIHAVDATLSGTGIVLADRRLIEGELSAERLFQLATKPIVSARGIYVVHPTNSAKKSSVNVFVDWLLSEIENDNIDKH